MRQLKAGYFALEGLNSFACTYYFNYLFFLLRDQHGFGNRGNLVFSALHGCIYMFAAWYGGRFAQRRGYFTALRVGFGGMACALAVGLVLPQIAAQLLVLVAWTVSMCFTWPTLEALVSEREDARGLARMVGIYNVVWSGVSAVAYFLGGWLFERLGVHSLYWLPIAIYLAQAGLTFILERQARSVPAPAPPRIPAETFVPEAIAFQQPVKPPTFLRMAWFANPFAYIAINTVLAVVPQLAARFNLTPAQAGVFCSIWLFVRLAAFVGLWYWAGWHYRFRWLIASFIGLVGSFALLLLGGELWQLVAAQVVFGLATGLIYYSSLFYSMDVGEAKVEHGGLHEAAIGLGIFAGPAVGATTLHFLPQFPRSGIVAVSALLLAGLAGLVAIRLRDEAPGSKLKAQKKFQ